MNDFKDKRTLLLSSHNINLFFTKYANDTNIQDSMISMIDNMCYNASVFLDNFARQQQSNDTLALLSQFNTFKTDIKQDLSIFTNQIADDINSQLGQLILSINSIIDTAVSKINPNYIIQQIQQHIQQSSLEQTANTIIQTEQIIKNIILTPINSIQQQFYDTFSKLINNNNNTQPIIEQFNISSRQWMTHLETIIVSIKTLEMTVDSNDNNKFILKNITSELDKHIAILNTSITQINHNTQDLSYIKSIVESLVTKVERIKDDNFIHNTKSIKTAKVKGNIAEDKLYVLLQDHLPSRDNFTVQQVSGAPHSADILISRTDYPNIRIESKNYDDTYISHSQVEKFKRDLIERDNHGIFVSINTKISNKGDIDIEQLINGKFAIYLSKNNYDVDFIINLLYFIYKLDSIFTSSKSNILISPDTLLRFKDFILNTRETLNAMKERLRMTLNDLGRIDMDLLENIILQQIKSNDDSNISLICNSCQFTAKNKRGLNIHKSRCDTTSSTIEIL
jgi:hypothetical protein